MFRQKPSKKFSQKIANLIKSAWARLIWLGKNEKREVKELSSGRETWQRFCGDSKNLVKDFFVPHSGNNFKPWSLRPKSLASYVALALIIKLVAIGILFLSYPTPAELSAIVSDRIVALINQSRAEAGVESLKENNNLDKFAQDKGNDMITRDYFAHDTPDGKRPWQWIDKSEYDYTYAGENLAMDFVDAETVHDAFMKSPTHRRNILNSKYKDVGIAVLNGEINGHPTILLVEFFGTQRSDTASLATVKPVQETVKEQTPTTSKVLADAKPVATAEPSVKGSTTIVNKAEAKPIAEPKLINTESPAVTQPAAIINNTPENNEVITIKTDAADSLGLANLVVDFSKVILIAMLIFMVISLVLNILIKIRVQHPAIILQSAVAIALIIAMLLVKTHFTEYISSRILIL
ncbi:MAG: CAP domain-containing protein [Patescibacteria group bacterium]